MDITEINGNISHNVRYLRLKYGLSQASLAMLIGTGTNSLRRLESGDIPPRFNSNHICRICDIFGISSDAFIYCDIAKVDEPASSL